jgi:hypothetical protein
VKYPQDKHLLSIYHRQHRPPKSKPKNNPQPKRTNERNTASCFSIIPLASTATWHGHASTEAKYRCHRNRIRNADRQKKMTIGPAVATPLSPPPMPTPATSRAFYSIDGLLRVRWVDDPTTGSQVGERCVKWGWVG